ncbi:MAG: hypothetical protein HDR88_18510 [Bacteroides sp.]|nr:hypothetical protein [Bacteroides sp.]
MKKFLIAGIMAATMFGAMAVDKRQPQVFFKGDQAPVFKLGELKDCVFYNTERKTKTRSEAEGSMTVTFKLSYENQDDFTPMPVWIVNEDNLDDEMGFFMNGEAVVEGLTPGKYTIVYTFSNNSIPNYPHYLYIFKDDVEIFDDCEFIADPMEANKIISFKSLLPDGKEPTLPVKPNDDLMSEDPYDWTNATCQDISVKTMIYNEAMGIMGRCIMNIIYTTPSGLTSYENLDLAVNEVNDKWSFSQLRVMETIDNNVYVTSSAVTGVNTVPPVNDLEFSEFDANFAINPITDEFGRRDLYFYYVAAPTFDNKDVGMAISWNPTGDTPYRYFLGAPKSTATSKHIVDYYLLVQQIDYDYDGMISREIGGTMTPPVTYDAVSQSTVFTMNGAAFFGSPIWWTEDSRNPEVFPGNTGFATTATKLEIPLGYTTPINLTSLLPYEYPGQQYPYLSVSTNYIGIYGEDRPDKLMSTAFIIPTDEEEVECEMTELNRELDVLCQAGKLNKPFTIEMANDRNILVDGIQGKNITQQYYENVMAHPYGPTATMLQFRDNTGMINNSFKIASEGEILLSGGDFEFTGYDTGWILQPINLKVEYAPANSSNFKEIEMIEEPGNLYMPSYGYFWKGDLSNVEGLTDKGWYQLRITMEDEDGNNQTQTIYPAFQILANSGVEDVAIDSDNTPTEYYNLQGLPITNPTEGTVVIRRQGGKIVKIVVK